MAAAIPKCSACESVDCPETYCIECEQLYCHKCSRVHRRQKATRSHSLVDITNISNDFDRSIVRHKCNACDDSETVNGLCLVCFELFCEDCIKRHKALKATLNHNVIAAHLLKADDLVSVHESEADGDKYSVAKSHRSDASSAQVQIGKGPYSGVFTHEFMSSAKSDKEVTSVRGIAILTNGYIVVADYKNRSLKLFNKDLTFVSAKDMKDEPRGMAYILPDDQVAVTFSDKKEVRLFKFESNKIRTHKSFKMKEKPFSIGYHKNYLAIEVGEGDDGAIHIVDINGKQRAVIPGFTRSYGQFTGNTIRLALDYAKELVFVCDVVKERVHCLNFLGTLKWSVHVESPRGIILHEDHLFIASSESHKIYQMSADDGVLYMLFDEDNRIKRPRYIAFQPKLKTLAVEIDGNHIKLYSIMSGSESTEL